ncbi:MAG: hypothetical protein KA586_04840 [Candidatus Promineofilum sp.]|nr:hypothetical protein [Promineifilum sp.]
MRNFSVARAVRPLFLVVLLLALIGALNGLTGVAAAADPAYHTLITVNANGFARQDKPVEVFLNFTPLLADQGGSGALDPASIRVFEVNNNDNVIDADVPFQFDRAGDYSATNKARGTLVFLMKGSTAANETRRYQVYFDVVGSGFNAPSFADRVDLSTVSHKGYQSLRLVTDNAEYFYHKPGGGFATLLDANNNDWIDWNTAAGGAGDFRGIPNMVHPNDGGYFHPGRNSVATTVLSDGPLKATFKSVSQPNGLWEVRWDVFPGYARMTVVRQGTANFWWLYEGTPGGELEPSVDRLTRSDGSNIKASGTWTNDIAGDEWIFVTDPNVGNNGRSLFLIHHQADSKVDGYTADSTNSMTIFGFGRSGNTRLLNTLPQQFTLGFTDETAVGSVEPVVNAAYKPLSITGQNDPGDDPGPGPVCNPLPFDVYVSPKKNVQIDGVGYADEDVVLYNGTTCEWSLVFDGTAHGLPAAANIDALAVDGSDLYISFLAPLTVPGISGKVDDSDVVKFSGGVFSPYFDGSNFGLSINAEDVDAIAFDETGKLLMSTTGAYLVNGLPKGQDEDVLRFDGAAWAVYFDGSNNAGLGAEDISGVDVLSSGEIALSVLDSFSVPGLKGNGADIFVCTPSSLGYLTTDCTYSSLWRSTDYDLASFDAFDIK